MRILVCGGRDYADWYNLRNVLDQYVDINDTIISGGAKGADSMAHEYALLNEIVSEVYYADWELYGKKAGPLRNIQMLKEGKPDLVIAFPGGTGTAHMVKIAKEAGVEVICV